MAKKILWARCLVSTRLNDGRVRLGAIVLLAVFLACSTTWGATTAVSKPITINVNLELQAVEVNVCDQSFQQLQVTSSPFVYTRYRSSRIGNSQNSVTLPGEFQASSNAGNNRVVVHFQISTTAPPIKGEMFLPDIPPILDGGNPSSAGSPTYCQLVAEAARLYPTFSGVAVTPLVSLTFKKGNLNTINNSVGLKKVIVPATARVKSVAVLAPVLLPSGAAAQRPGPSGISYLIITQDLYRPEAQELADYRNSQGVATQVISVSELPGYDAKGPSPKECAKPYDRVCYHFWGDPIANVSQLAVPSLVGFHRQTMFAEHYQKVSYIPGLIQAYLRRLKPLGLKAVLLIGDPELVPPMFTPVTDYTTSGRIMSMPCTDFNYVSEPTAADYAEYCEGDSRFTLGTDLYYAIPSTRLTVTKKVNMAQLTPFMTTCENQTNTTREMKEWCDNTEHRYWGVNVNGHGTMALYGWSPYYPFTRTFDDPVSGQRWQEFAKLSATDVLAIGRIVTHTPFHAESTDDPRGFDPAVQNYVDKLRSWELAAQHHGVKYPSVATFGGDDHWVWTADDVKTFFSTTGIVPDTSSMLYGSQVYFTQWGLAGVCDAALHPSQCMVKDPITILEDLRNANYTMWLGDGHGDHPGFAGPSTPSSQLGFGVFNAYGIGSNDNLRDSVDPDVASTRLLENSGHFIGHVIADSCDVSSYFDYSSFNWLIYTGTGPPSGTGTQGYRDSLVAPASFAETLIGLPNGGAINTYMNYFSGLPGPDNSYDDIFMEYADQSRSGRLPIGNAYVNMVADILTNTNHQGYGYQLLNRVALGDPLAIIGPQ